MVKKLKKTEDRKNVSNYSPMQNITINIPDLYDENIKFLQKKGIVANRSEAIRIAIGEFLYNEYYMGNLDLLNFWNKEDRGI